MTIHDCTGRYCLILKKVDCSRFLVFLLITKLADSLFRIIEREGKVEGSRTFQHLSIRKANLVFH